MGISVFCHQVLLVLTEDVEGIILQEGNIDILRILFHLFPLF